MTADFQGYTVHADGWIEQRRSPGRQLLPHEVKGGYLRVTLWGHHHLVHVIVAEAFLGPKPPGAQVNHIDGNKINNAVTNLEYLTPSANTRHSIDVLHTDRAPGSKNANAKLTEANVIEMRRRADAGEPAIVIAPDFDITYGTAWRIVTRRTWRHVA